MLVLILSQKYLFFVFQFLNFLFELLDFTSASASFPWQILASCTPSS